MSTLKEEEVLKFEPVETNTTDIRLDCFNLATEIMSQDEIANIESIFLLADRIYNWVINDGR